MSLFFRLSFFEYFPIYRINMAKMRFILLVLTSFVFFKSNAQAPVADFTISDDIGCASPSHSVTYTNVSTGTFDSTRWVVRRVPSGALVSLVTGTNVFTDAYNVVSNYQVCLTVVNRVTNQSSTFCDTVYVYAPPVPVIVAPSTMGCVPFDLTFSATNNTGTPLATYNWNFPGTVAPGTSTSPNPTVTYNSIIGSPHDIFLQVTDINGCPGSTARNDIITTLLAPASAFNGAPRIACSAPLNVTFNNTSTFSNASGVTPTFTWFFGDSPTPLVTNSTSPINHTYNNCGSYDVTLIVSYPGVNCSDTLVMPDYIEIDDVTASFTSSVNALCLNADATFTPTSNSCLGSPLACSWNFGDASPLDNTCGVVTHTYNSVGCFPPTLTVSTPAGCSASANLPCINVSNGPTATFSATGPSTSCTLPFTVNFNNTGTTSPTATYEWDFGNPLSPNNTSTLSNPSHTYTACGDYNVTLIVRDPAMGTCAATTTMPAFVRIDTVSSSFTQSTSSICAGMPISFTNTSQICSSNPTYSWSIGANPPFATTTNSSSVFGVAGTYMVNLLTSSPIGCTATSSRNVTITPAPNVTFTATPQLGCSLPHAVTFTDQTAGNIVSRRWMPNMAAGTFFNGVGNTFTHIYTQAGSYSVILEVTDNAGCIAYDTLRDFIRVGEPLASFTRNNRNGCIPLDVRFNSTSTSLNGDPIVDYIWNFDAGNSPGVIVSTPNSTITHTINDTLCHDVSLIVVTSLGCRDTARIDDAVCAGIAPAGSFIIDTTEVCIRGFVNYYNTSVGVFDTLIWAVEFPGGLYIGVDTVQHQYTTDTICYLPRLIIGHNNCLDTVSVDSVCVLAPLARFSHDVDCSDTTYTVNFVDESGSRTTNWWWDFGDLNVTSDTSEVQNPSYTYPGPGTYSVRMIVWDSIRGCRDTIDQTISINNANAYFELDTSQGCATFVMNSRNVDPSMSTYTWTAASATVLNQGTAGGRFSYATPGNFNETITLEVFESTSGCRDTFSRTLPVSVHGLTSNFTPPPLVCHDYSRSFVSTSTASNGQITDYAWDFGDASPIVTTSSANHTYTTVGTYNVRLTVTDGINSCQSSTTQSISIGDPIASIASLEDSACVNQPLLISSSSQNHNQLTWSANTGTIVGQGAASPSIVFTTPGVARDTLTLVAADAFGCRDTVVLDTTFYISQVTASFIQSDTIGCLPLTVTFIDNSSTVLGTLTRWDWNLVNSQVTQNGTTTPVSETYTTQNAVFPTLQVTNSFGCSATALGLVQATQPLASFNLDDLTLCVGQTLSMTNTSQGNSLSSFYTMGNGDTVFVNAPTMTYSYGTGGNYNICLFILDNGGCRDSICQTLDVSRVDASFVAAPIAAACPPLVTTFTDQSTGNIVSWDWNFLDNNVPIAGVRQTSGAPFAYTFNFPGIYDVRLAVLDNFGCVDTFIISDLINIDGPIGSFSFINSSGCIPLPVDFTISVVNTDSVQLVTRNGTIGFNTNPLVPSTINYTHNYNVAGDFNPVLILTDATGCSVAYPTTDSVHTEELELTLTQNGTFNCNTDTITYVAVVTSSEIPVTNWTTNGGTVLSSTSTRTILSNSPFLMRDTLVHTVIYNIPGYYTVDISTTNSGCTRTVLGDSVLIAGSPTSFFTFAIPDPCVPDSVVFNNSSNTPFGQITSYQWAFGDNTTSTTTSPTHLFPRATTVPVDYTVTLTVANEYGCSATFSTDVRIFPTINPIADGDTTICLFGTAPLRSSGGINYQWSPTTGLSCSNCPNPIASPSRTTNYILAVDNGGFCTVTFNVGVTVIDVEPIISPPNPTICFGDLIQLFAQGADFYAWSPSAGLSATTGSAVVASPQTTTTYQVIGIGALGCRDTANVTVTVVPLPTLSILTPDTFVCPGSTIQIRTTTSATTPVYTWGPTATLSCGNCANPFATPTGLTTYRVTVTEGATSCSVTDEVTVFVYTNPITNVVPSDTTICPGDTILLRTFPVNVGREYDWSPALGLSSTTVENPYAFPMVSTNYSLTITLPTGCTVTNTANVNVVDFTDITVGYDTLICSGSSVNLFANTNAPATFIWAPATGLSDPNIANPIASPTVTTNYVLTIDRQNCQFIDSALIEVVYDTDLRVAGEAICTGDTTQIVATGARAYVWTPSDGLSDPNIADPLVFPTVTTTYLVRGSVATCNDDVDTITVVVHPLPDADILSSRTSFFLGESIQLTGTTNSAGNTISWIPTTYLTCSDCTNPTSVPDTTITYFFVAVDTNGCENSDNITLRLIDQCNPENIVVPNAFTPNGDGNNDRLFVRRIPSINSFVIYDRWGKKVFHTSNINDGWDGKIDRADAQSGVYVWVVEAPCPIDGSKMVKKGNVSLIR